MRRSSLFLLATLAFCGAALAHGGASETKAFEDIFWGLVGMFIGLVIWLFILFYGIAVFRYWATAWWLFWSLGGTLFVVLGSLTLQLGWALFIAWGTKLAIDLAVCRYGHSQKLRRSREEAANEAEANTPEEILRRQKVLAGKARPSGT